MTNDEILNAVKYLDDAPMPLEDRMLWPESVSYKDGDVVYFQEEGILRGITAWGCIGKTRRCR